MRMMVTGGAGFIGSHVARAALQRGWTVGVLDDLSGGVRENVPEGVPLFEADVRDPKAVQLAFEEFRPTVVSHHAAQISVSRSMREPLEDAEVNVIGGLNVAEACLAHRVGRIVFASTGGALYGEVPEDETAGVSWSAKPESPYGVHKLAFEGVLPSYGARGLQSVVLRYANVYGPHQSADGEAGVVAIFMERGLAGQTVTINARSEVGDAGCVRDYVAVSDVVKANLWATTTAPTGTVLDVGTGVGTTTRQLAQEVAGALGVELSVSHGEPRAGDLGRSVLDPSEVRAAIGELKPLRDGLAQTAAWFRSRGKA